MTFMLGIGFEIVPALMITAAVMVLQDRITLLKGRIDYYQGMEEEEVLYNLTRNFQRCNSSLHKVNASLEAIKQALD